MPPFLFLDNLLKKVYYKNMIICVNDKELLFKFDNKLQEEIYKEKFTFVDNSNAFSTGGFNSRKSKKVCFIKEKKGIFKTGSGFLQETLKTAKENNFPIEEFQDKRTHFNHQKTYSKEELKEYLNPKFEYTEHQTRVLSSVIKTNIGIVKATTSSGKTEMIIALMKLTNLPTLILVNKVDLAIQTRDRIEREDIECGIMTGSLKNIQKNMVATIGSVKKIPNLHLFAMLILDEVHRASSKQFIDFLSSTSYPLRYGFSATPEGNDKYSFAKIRQYMGSIIAEVKAQELIENEVIVKPTIHFIDVQSPPTLDWSSANELCIINNKKRNDKIKEIIEKYKLPSLILITNIEHGEMLEKNIPGSVFVSGKDDTKIRQQIIKDFEEHKIQTIISSNIFNEGISINAIRLLIIASGKKSNIETTQKIGRSLRKDEGKTEALVFDFFDYGNKFTEKHSLLRQSIYKKIGFEVQHT